MQAGIIGLPNVGKSTLFNALTRSRKAEAANYPFCTIEPNVGVVIVPDARLPWLQTLSKSEKIIPAAIEFVDIAGLVAGASKGEGLGNKFLSNIREVDAVVHVVRCFETMTSSTTWAKWTPSRYSGIETELILADIQSCEKQLDNNLRKAKGRTRTLLRTPIC
jgi:GTP-binding protein YchF